MNVCLTTQHTEKNGTQTPLTLFHLQRIQYTKLVKRGLSCATIRRSFYATTSMPNNMEKHFARVTHGFGVKVVQLSDKGRGVVATKDFKEGDVVFSELPLALSRSMHSHFPPVTTPHQMHHSNFCAYCLKSLAKPEHALPDTFPAGHTLPYTDRFWPKTDVHTCDTCNIEKYCGDKCKSSAKAAYHHLMCAGPPPQHTHPMVRLQLGCMKHDTNYPLQAGRIIAMAATLFSRLNHDDEIAMWEISPFSKFYTVSGPLPVFDSTPEVKQFVYDTAYELLHEAMFKDKYPKLRPPETRQTLINYIQNMNKLGAEIMQLPEDGEIIFHKLTKTAGCGMFSLHSQMNHSCAPNVKTVTEKNSTARLDVVAVNPIKEGEEVCIDYVGVKHTPVADRKQMIADRYCFECKCPKCISES